LGTLTSLIAAGAQGQVVRGVASEAGADGRPLAGVLIELVRLSATSADSGIASAALSDASGAFAVRATRAGRFVLSAKRIGVRRFRSSPVDLGPGETVVRNVVLDPVSYTLPEIVVTGLVSCDSGHSTETLAALWDEARTALFATQLSLRDSLFTARVTRYLRELEPRSKRVLNEYRSEARGVVVRPFAAMDPDSVAARGYVHDHRDGSTTYHGLDAEILLSDGFVRSHCFHPVAGRRDMRGLVGLGFRPLGDSSVVNVRGTLWLAERTSELRLVEFGYVGPFGQVQAPDVVGQLHFERLPSGAWILQRWFLRLPGSARSSMPLGTDPSGGSWVLVRPEKLVLREEGGSVTVLVR
jgi:hypothetical protein